MMRRELLILTIIFILAIIPAVHAVEIVTPAEEASGFVIVVDPTAQLTVGPSDEYAVLEVVEEDDVFPLLGKNGNWCYVKTGEETYGWIHGEALAEYEYESWILKYEPPADWVPAEPGWVPPPNWVPPPGWKIRPLGWKPGPRWAPKWWKHWRVKHQYTPLAPRRPRRPALPPKKPPRRPPPPPFRR